MKKILAAMLVLAGGVAFAQMDATEVGPELKEESKEIGKGAKENVKEWGEQAGLATEEQGTFKTADAFDLKGDVKEGGRGEITVARQGLPDADLDIRDQTKVWIDGKEAKAKDIKKGMKVDAKFQLEGDETVAVEVKATSPEKAMGGAGEAGKKDEYKADDKAAHEADKAEDKAEHELKD